MDTTTDTSQEYWLTENPQPALERNWSAVCRDYTTTSSDRHRIATAIDNVRWHRLDDPVPFSPGQILEILIAEAHRAGLPPLAMGIGADPIEYPEAHLLGWPRAAVPPGYWETGYLVALRQLVRRTTFSAYFLVLSDQTAQVALDINDQPLPPGPMTKACAARLHELCKGQIDGAQCACPCPPHTT